MKVSMDGLRRNLTRHVKHVRDLVEKEPNHELHHAMDRLIVAAHALNCVYDDEQEDFSDMSDTRTETIGNKDI